MRSWTRLGAAGAALGAAAAGAAVGLAAERYAVGRSFRRRRPQPDEPIGTLRGRPLTVCADDGVRLHVEVEGDDDAPLTLVFSHGYALTQDCWHFQRRDLADVGRLVFWDQRGHGRSERGARETANIDQLGRDLRRVIEAVAPGRPVVLVGHSMGGMTVMALADQHPEMFGEQVIGVALIATSAGKLAEVFVGVPAYAGRWVHRFAPAFLDVLVRRSQLVERGRQAGNDLSYVMTRRFAFDSDVPSGYVESTARMIASTPIEVLADFFPAFETHDKLEALDVLNGVETLILVADGDLLTPSDHSRAMVKAVPGAELVVLPRGGHMVLFEHHEAVSQALRDLVQRASRAAGGPGRQETA